MKLKKGSNHKYGYVDRKTGEWLIQPMYERATQFTTAGIAIVTLVKGRKIIINKNNKNVTGKIYESVEVLRGGYIKAIEIDLNNPANMNKMPRNRTNYVFLRPDGKEIEELRNVFVVDVTQYNTVEFTFKDKYGVYNLKTGKVIKAKYDRIFNFNDDKGSIPYAVVYKGDKTGLIDWDDNVIIPFEYQDLIPYARFGVIIAKLSNVIGVLDFEGNEIYPFEFSSHSATDDTLGLDKIVTTYIKAKESEEDVKD